MFIYIFLYHKWILIIKRQKWEFSSFHLYMYNTLQTVYNMIQNNAFCYIFDLIVRDYTIGKIKTLHIFPFITYICVFVKSLNHITRNFNVYLLLMYQMNIVFILTFYILYCNGVVLTLGFRISATTKWWKSGNGIDGKEHMV